MHPLLVKVKRWVLTELQQAAVDILFFSLAALAGRICLKRGVGEITQHEQLGKSKVQQSYWHKYVTKKSFFMPGIRDSSTDSGQQLYHVAGYVSWGNPLIQEPDNPRFFSPFQAGQQGSLSRDLAGSALLTLTLSLLWTASSLHPGSRLIQRCHCLQQRGTECVLLCSQTAPEFLFSCKETIVFESLQWCQR